GLLSAGHSGEALGQSAGHRVVRGVSAAVGVFSRGDAAALDPRFGFAPPELVLSPCASTTASTIRCDWRSTSRSRALPSCWDKAERARPHYCAPSPACCPPMANRLAVCYRSSVPWVICPKAMLSFLIFAPGKTWRLRCHAAHSDGRKRWNFWRACAWWIWQNIIQLRCLVDSNSGSRWRGPSPASLSCCC